jgi:hypothetical protein
MADFQHMFFSTDPSLSTAGDAAAMSRSAEKLRADAGLFLRVFVDSFALTFQDDRLAVGDLANEIELRAASIVFSSTISKLAAPSFSFNIAELSLKERIFRDETSTGQGFLPSEHLLVFFENQCPREDSSVIPQHPSDLQRMVDSLSLAGPQVEISVVVKPAAEGGVNVGVNFLHARCDLPLASVHRWTHALSEFFAPQTSPSSAVAFSCSIAFKSVEVILTHSPSGLLDNNRRQPFHALPMPSPPSARWKKVRDLSVPSSHPGGGFRAVFHGLSLALSSNAKATSSPSMGPFTIAVDEINVFLQLRRHPIANQPHAADRLQTWELGFLSLRSEANGEKISLSKEKYLGPEGISAKSEGEESERVIAGDLFEIPALAVSEVFVISAGNVYAGRASFSLSSQSICRPRP